jgi:hypothetical protein
MRLPRFTFLMATVRWVSPVTCWTTSTRTFSLRSRIPNTGFSPQLPGSGYPFFSHHSMIHPFQSLPEEWMNDRYLSWHLIAWTGWRDRKQCHRRGLTGEQVHVQMYPTRKVILGPRELIILQRYFLVSPPFFPITVTLYLPCLTRPILVLPQLGES